MPEGVVSSNWGGRTRAKLSVPYNMTGVLNFMNAVSRIILCEMVFTAQPISAARAERLDPIKKVAKTIKEHLWCILNAVVLKLSNGPAEGINSRIKIRCRGFRNKERVANAIYFRLGGPDLYPEAAIR